MTNPINKAPYLQGLTGQVANQRFNIEATLSIGAGVDQALQLQDESVANSHAKITYQGDHLELQASETVMLNGEVVKSAQLRSGDELRIGQQRFVVKMPGLRPESVLRDVKVEKSSNKVLVWLGVGLAIAGAAAAVYFTF